MAGVVVDTDVASFLFRNGQAAKQYAPHLRGKSWTISFMTLAEVEYGMIHRGWGRARERHRGSPSDDSADGRGTDP